MKRRDPPEYEVGYQKPPKHTRFKKGQSGNPKGRPKGSLNLATALNKALREVITVVENGKRTRMTKLDAATKSLVNRAVKGDAKAMQQMLGLAPLVGVDPTGAAPVGANDAAVMAALWEQLRPRGDEKLPADDPEEGTP